MRKRGIAFLMVLALTASSVLSTGITASAEDIVSAQDTAAVEAVAEELPVDVSETMETVPADGVVAAPAAGANAEVAPAAGADVETEAEVLQENGNPEETQQFVPQSDEDEYIPNEDEQADQIIEEPTAVEEVMQEPPAGRGADYEAPKADEGVDLVISDIEVIDGEIALQDGAQTKAIKSVKFDIAGPLTFNVLDVIPGLQTIPVTVSYDDGSEEKITSWTVRGTEWQWWGADLSNGNTLSLVLELTDTLGTAVYLGGFIPIGTFNLTVGAEDVNDSISVTIEETEFEKLPESVAIPSSQDIYKGYRIPAQSSDSVLKIAGSSTAQTEVALYSKSLYQPEAYWLEPMPLGSFHINISKNFGLDAGRDYVLFLKNPGSGDVDETVSFTIEKKKTVQSVTIRPEASYNFFELEEKLADLSAVVRYDDGTEEMINGGWTMDWIYEGDGEEGDGGPVFCHDTDNTDLVTVSLWDGAEKINIEYLRADKLPAGTLALKVAVNGVRQNSNTDVPVDIIVGPTESGFPSETELLPGQTKAFLISPTEEDRVLNVSNESQADDGGVLDVFLYQKESDRFFYANEGDTLKIEAGKEYLLALRNESWNDHPCKAELSFEKKQAISSVSITGIKESYDTEEARELMWDLNVRVVYGEGAYTADVDYWYDPDKDYIDSYYGETSYGEIIIVELKNSDGVKINVPTGDPIAPGSYYLTAYVEGTEIRSETIAFAVTDTDMESFVLEKEYSVNAGEGYEKWFSFTPSEDGEYVFDFLNGDGAESDCRVDLYDNQSCNMGTMYGNDDGLFINSLKKGQTYYYVVNFYSAGQTTIKLRKKKLVTSVTLESPPTETTFMMEEDFDEAAIEVSGMKVRLYYSDGDSQVVEAGKADQYGNYIELGYCPLHADGSPDLSKIQGYYDEEDNCLYWEGEAGTYALLAGVGHWDDDYNLVFEVTPVWTKIVVVPYGHVHSWNAPVIEIAPTCTTEGKQSIYCSCGTMKPGSATTVPKLSHSWKAAPTIDMAPTCTTEGRQAIYCSVCGMQKEDSVTTIPKLAHSWGDWSIATEGQAVLSRTCVACHTLETKRFSPVLTLTDKKLTMKIGQSTTKFKVTDMAEYDSLVDVKSSNTKVLKVLNISAKGTFKLKAQKKSGTAKLTITLKSGAARTIKVKVQKAKVKTTKIKVESKKLTLKKKQKMKLAPVIMPVTSYDKVKYTSSNKKVAVVSNKGQITAKDKGTATITVKSGNKKVQVKVTVK